MLIEGSNGLRARVRLKARIRIARKTEHFVALTRTPLVGHSPEATAEPSPFSDQVWLAATSLLQ